VGLSLWGGCLVLMWGWAFDPGGRSTLLSLLASALAGGTAVFLPGRVARGVQSLCLWMGWQDLPTMELASADAGALAPADARTVVRLVGGAMILSALGGLASTLGVFLVAGAADLLAGELAWTSLSWHALMVLGQWAAMLPLATGVSVLVLAGAMLLAGDEADPFAPVVGDLVLAGGAGLVLLAGVWLAGVHLLAVVLVTAVGLVAGGAVLLSRPATAVRPRGLARPVDVPSPRRGLAVALGAGGAALLGLLQLRGLDELAGVGLSGKLLWVGGSLAVLAVLLARVDARRVLAPTDHAGALIAVATGALLQVSILGTYPATAFRAVVFSVGPVLAQIPILACGAVVLASQRRRFVAAGGRARSLLAWAALGLAGGLAMYMVAFSLPRGHLLLVAVGLGVLVAGLVEGISSAGRANVQVGWAILGVALICSLMAGVLTSLAQGNRRLGRVQPGVWLTASAEATGQPVRGALPHSSLSRSGQIDLIVSGMLARRPGVWWIVRTSPLDVPPLPEGVHATVSTTDETVPADGDPSRPARPGGFHLHSQIADRRYDGLLLAPLPADHPQGWRCYNRATMVRCFAKVHPGGPMLLRTQVTDSDRLDVLPGLVRTFAEVVGSGVVAMAPVGGGWDVLLAGPGGVIQPPSPGGTLRVVTVHHVMETWPDVPPVRLMQVRPAPWNRPDADRVARKLGRWMIRADGPVGK
jgi:hypothetical protein